MTTLTALLEHVHGFFQHLHELGLIAHDDFQAFSAAFAAFKAEQNALTPPPAPDPTTTSATPTTDATNG